MCAGLRLPPPAPLHLPPWESHPSAHAPPTITPSHPPGGLSLAACRRWAERLGAHTAADPAPPTPSLPSRRLYLSGRGWTGRPSAHSWIRHCSPTQVGCCWCGATVVTDAGWVRVSVGRQRWGWRGEDGDNGGSKGFVGAFGGSGRRGQQARVARAGSGASCARGMASAASKGVSHKGRA